MGRGEKGVLGWRQGHGSNEGSQLNIVISPKKFPDLDSLKILLGRASSTMMMAERKKKSLLAALLARVITERPPPASQRRALRKTAV